MRAEEKILKAGYSGVVLLENFSYDTALVGVTTDGRAVYDYEKMIAWLVDTQGFTEDEAVEWINYNTVGALPNAGDAAPVIMYPL